MRSLLTSTIIGSDEFWPAVSLTAPVALRAPCAAKETETNKVSVTDVMALFGVTDVVALETYPLTNMRKHSTKMHLFKSREPNLVHYVTAVAYNRVPIFRSERACLLLIDA